MKFNNNGKWQDISLKVLDTLPVGAVVDYDGTEVPDGWEEADALPTSIIIPITPINGNNYANYGNSYYYKNGSKVHIHLGISDLGVDTTTVVYTMPEGLRPYSTVGFAGIAGNVGGHSGAVVYTNGNISVASAVAGYACIDIEYDVFK